MELIANRPRPLPPKPEMGFRAGDLLLLRVVLDAIQPEDQIDGSCAIGAVGSASWK